MSTVMSYARVWIAAARPHTLSASVVPVVVGTALSVEYAPLSWGLFALVLAASVLVQVGANLTDEYADHATTQSAHKYLAPHKVIARGQLSPRAVKAGAATVFAAATAMGLYLVWHAGWPILAVCLVSLAVAWAYSAGPLPLGDYALGEPLVFVIMGPVMVGGTVYVLTLTLPWTFVWVALPVGALVTAILVVNNLRDAGEDRRTGRRTLVTVFGEGALVLGYRGLVALAYLSPLVVLPTQQRTVWLLLPWLTLPLAARLVRLIGQYEDREAMHRALKGTSALHLTFGLLLAAGLLADTLLPG